jgi:hypothetical protein
MGLEPTSLQWLNVCQALRKISNSKLNKRIYVEPHFLYITLNGYYKITQCLELGNGIPP